jgi:hypothetical protein
LKWLRKFASFNQEDEMFAFLIFIVGAGLLAQGLSLEHAAESAMHQIYSGIYVGSGVITMALAFVVRAIDGVWDEAKAARKERKAQQDVEAKAEKDRRDREFEEGARLIQERNERAARDAIERARAGAIEVERAEAHKASALRDSAERQPEIVAVSATAPAVEKKPYIWGSATRSSAGGSRPCPNCGRNVPDEQAICDCGYGFSK